jgi:integrase/recombinase XerD
MNYQNYLKNKGFSPSSIKSYQVVSNRFNKWIKDQHLTINQITYNDITSYINHLQGKRNKQRTIQLEISALKHYLDYQKLMGNILNIPINNIKIQGVKRQGIYDILTPEELDYIYKSYPSENYNLQNQALNSSPREDVHRTDGKIIRNKIIIGLLVYQGLSTTDLANIKLEHIQLHRGTIDIPPTKKSNGRTLKLEAHQAITLQQFILIEREQLLKKHNKTTEHLIFSLGTGNNIYNLLFKLMKQLKAQHLEITSAKQIRASVITNWLKQYNLRETQYRAGHKFVSSTENYKINDIETLKNDIIQFSPNL